MKAAKPTLYDPVLKGIPHWPVYQLSKHRKEFLEEVTKKSIEHINALRPDRKKLIDEIEMVVYRELNQIKRDKSLRNSSLEEFFWRKIKTDITKLANEKETNEHLESTILERIIQKYSYGISGAFRPNHYRFVRGIVKFCFARLLNGTRLNKTGSIFKTKYRLRDKVSIRGEITMLRKLVKQGTVIIVPTHFSHLDSIVVAWVVHFLGLPAFIYGAGVNLFKVKLLAYFMNSLGIYKIDRKKKNLLYLETLKMYSSLALERGNHSLFFPGGTRSQSGSIETKLRRGLLGAAIQAQRNIYMKNPDQQENLRKIFIVPVAINYHVVLEAPDLIKNHLRIKWQDRYLSEDTKYKSLQLLKFLIKFFTKGSTISVSIGGAMDIVGNYVNEHGDSLNNQRTIVNTRDYFVSNDQVNINLQREDQYARMLSKRIVSSFYAIGEIYASHIIAFVAFEIWKKKYDKLDLFGLLKVPKEELIICYNEFEKEVEKVRIEAFKLAKVNRVHCADHLHGDLSKVIQYGLENIGVFHIKRPLLMDKKKNIITQDIVTLYYYHNRLNNYGFEILI